MRIVGGKWRGRALGALGAGDAQAHLRPSSDRFRETTFNILRQYGAPEEMRVLDLFAGTGALGLEALSQGAAFASFVDQGAKSCAIIRKNIAHLGCEAQAELLNRDALNLGVCNRDPYHIAFLDPPYGQSLGERSINNAKANNWLAENALVIWEDEVPPNLPAFLQLVDQRQIGRAILTIARNGE